MQPFARRVSGNPLRLAPKLAIKEYSVPSQFSLPRVGCCGQVMAETSDGNVDFIASQTGIQTGAVVRFAGGTFTALPQPQAYAPYAGFTSPMVSSPTGPVYVIDMTQGFDFEQDEPVLVGYQGTALLGTIVIGSASDFTESAGTDAEGKFWWSDDAGTLNAYKNFPIGPRTSASTTDIFTAMAYGPNNALWLYGVDNSIYEVSAAGVLIKQFALPYTGGHVSMRMTALGNSVWFLYFQNYASSAVSIIRMTKGGTFTQFPLPSGVAATALAAGGDGAIWFISPSSNQLGRMSSNGKVKLYSVPTANAGLAAIAGPFVFSEQCKNGPIWFMESNANKIGSI
jgi:hypothetical protein